MSLDETVDKNQKDMKKRFAISLATLMLAACGTRGGSELTTLENCATDKDSTNTTIKLNYPKAENKAYPKVTDSINSYVKELVANSIPEPLSPMPEGITFPVESYLGWRGQVNENIVELQLNSYVFTGGAHGMSQLWCEPFDAKNGERSDLHKFLREPQVIIRYIS